MDGSIKTAKPAEPLRAIYEPGEAVYSPKDPMGRTFTVESGIVDVLSMDDGDDALIATYYRGSTFSYPDGIEHSRLPAIARSREKSVIIIREEVPMIPAPPPPKEPAKKKSKAKDVLRRKVIYAGEILFSEGDVGNAAFIIESGDVEIFRTEHGKEIQLGVVGEGSIIGEMALIDDEPRMATARAQNQVVVVTVWREAFESKVAKVDPFIRKLLLIMVRYTRLHADYFVKARADLHETYQVLGLDPEEPDFDRLKEMSWQSKQAEELARKKAQSESDADNSDTPLRRRRVAAKSSKRSTPKRQSASAMRHGKSASGR